jgi:hypothetical protein
MKVEFFIEAIYYHPENPTPSVVIAVKNKIESLAPEEPIFADSRSDMKKILKDLFMDSVKTHKTSFMVTLEEYRKSGMMVGDRLEIEMTIKNNGEITQ